MEMPKLKKIPKSQKNGHLLRSLKVFFFFFLAKKELMPVDLFLSLLKLKLLKL